MIPAKLENIHISVDKTVYLSKLIATIEKINKRLHCDISDVSSRLKCFGLLTWLFGWGTYTNAKNIKKIKQNLQILQEWNNLQEAHT